MSYSFREKDFQRFRIFFLLVAMATRVMDGIKFFEKICRASPKEHPCQVSSRLTQWYRRRCVKKLMDTGCQTKGDHNSSGELKSVHMYVPLMKYLVYSSLYFSRLNNSTFYRYFLPCPPLHQLSQKLVFCTDTHTDKRTGRTNRLIPVYPENIHFAEV